MKTVNASFKVNGHAMGASVTIDVLQPIATVVTTIGAVGFNSTRERVGLFANANSPDGITFTGNVTDPSGFKGGAWRWLQTMTPSSTAVDIDGSNWKIKYHGLSVLDANVPFAPQIFNPATDLDYYPIPDSEGGSSGPKTAADAPSNPFLGYISGQPATILYFKRVTISSETFQMYLMYKPDGISSRYVPLSVVNWGWSISAVQGVEGWMIEPNSSAQFVGPPTATSTHPVWTQRFKAEGYEPQ